MKPSIGQIVHYFSYGSPGGEFPSVCRAAIITELCNNQWTCPNGDNEPCVGLCVLNPTGQFFNTHVAHYSPFESTDLEGMLTMATGGIGWRTPKPGTWHWPERVEE